MKIVSFYAGLFLTGCATGSNMAAPANIDGTWRGEADMGGGFGGPPMEMAITCNFKSDGDVLTGTFSGGAPDSWIPIQDGEIGGTKISIMLEAPSQWATSIFNYKCEFVDSDTIKMSYSVKTRDGNTGMGPSGIPGKFTVKRLK